MYQFKITKVTYLKSQCRTTYYVPKISLQCTLKAIIHHIKMIKNAMLFCKTTQIPLVKLLNRDKNPVALTSLLHTCD